MKKLITTFMTCSLFFGLTISFTSCGTIKYKETRYVKVVGEPGTDFYLVNQKAKDEQGHQIEDLIAYNKKGIIKQIGSIGPDGKGTLSLSTKEYKRSKKYVYATKEGSAPTRFKLGRKFNALMLADIAPIIMLFDQARIINEKNTYQITSNFRSELQASKVGELTEEQRKERRSRRLANTLTAMTAVGSALEAIGNTQGEQQVTLTESHVTEPQSSYNYTADPTTVEPTNSNSNSFYSFGYEEQLYKKWDDRIRTCYNFYTGTSELQKPYAWVNVQQCQREMRRIRLKAKKHGHHIEKSPFEDIKR